MKNRSKQQRLIDIMFQIAFMVHSHESFKGKDYDYISDYIREQLNACGFEVRPMGSSRAALMNESD